MTDRSNPWPVEWTPKLERLIRRCGVGGGGGLGGSPKLNDIITKNPWVDVRWFGATGDGVTDDTAAIQAAIDSVKDLDSAYSETTGGVVLFPMGIFKITSALDLTANCGVSLFGQGKTKSNLIYYGAAGTCMLDYTNSNNHRSEIRGLRLGGDTGMTRTCIDIPTAGNQIYVIDCWISNWENGIYGHPTGDCQYVGNVFEYVRRPFYMDTCSDLLISDNMFYRCGHSGVGDLQEAILDFDTCKRVQITNNRFVNDSATAHLKALVHLTDCEYFIVANNIEYDGTYTSFIGTAVIDGASKNIIISDNIWGKSEYYTIKVTGTSQYVTIEGNHLSGTRTAAYAPIFVDNDAQDVIIQGNLVRLNTQNYDISLGATNNVIIQGNKLEGNLYATANIPGLVIHGNDIEGTVSYLQDIQALADNETPTVKTDVLHKFFKTGSTTTITDFDDGIEGQVITILAEHSLTITDGTNIFLSGGTNWAMAATDTLTLVCKADNKWYEISRSDNT